jgi:TRAP-type C4-dicarboxylate transport system permease small subunit
MKMINKLAENILFIITSIILVIVFSQVGLRIIGVSVIWIEELSRFLFIWVVFLGAAVGIKYGVHLNVDYFITRRKKISRIIILYIGGILQIFFIAVLLIFSVILSRIWLDSTSPVLGIPIILVYSALPVSAILMILNTISVMREGLNAIRKEVR